MRKKPVRWSVRFELAPEDPEDVKLYTFLSDLLNKGEGSAWIRRVLRQAMAEHTPVARPKNSFQSASKLPAQPARITPPEPTYSDDDVETP